MVKQIFLAKSLKAFKFFLPPQVSKYKYGYKHSFPITLLLNEEMKAAYPLYYVLLVFCDILGAAQNSSGHDHFLLVQTWPNGYCSIVNCQNTPKHFVLHGLWPVDRNGTSLHNYTTPSIKMIDIVNYLFRLTFYAVFVVLLLSSHTDLTFSSLNYCYS